MFWGKAIKAANYGIPAAFDDLVKGF